MDQENTIKGRKYNQDHIIAVFICIVIFVLGCMNLDNNCNWGDDFAAYLIDGIAIAEGRYEEQTKLNVILRSGKLLDKQTEHVHVFGYPLLHALIYSLFRFDKTDYSNIILYKLPSLIALSIMSGVYFLFLRKRFGREISALMTLALCADMTLHNEIRNLCSDILFLSLTMCSFHFMELYLEKPFGRKRCIMGMFLGLLLWYCYSVRLNGIVAVICVFLAQFLWLVRQRTNFRASELIPLGSFLILYLVFNRLVFPLPTSTSSISDMSISGFLDGTEYYLDQIHTWARHFIEIVLKVPVKLTALVLYRVINTPLIYTVNRAENFIYRQVFDFLAALIMPFPIIGIVTEGIKKEVHIVIFILVSFAGTAALNLGQEIRYLYVILPFLLMYAAHGVKWIHGLWVKKSRAGRKHSILLYSALIYALCVFSVVPIVKYGLSNLRVFGRDNSTAYSHGAVQVYNYIQSELDEDDTIAFFKPRALYLNTGRVSLLPQEGGFKITDADYYLCYLPNDERYLTEELEDIYEPCFENYEFILYRKNEW